MQVTLDRIGSVTKNSSLSKNTLLSREIPCRLGTVVVGRVLEDQDTYNELEDLDGVFHRLKKGDVVAGVLGSRRALRGHSGDVPDSITVGDTIHLLNLGGVMGCVTSSSPEVGAPLPVEVLGVPLVDGMPATILSGSVTPAYFLQEMPPVVAFVGTCMHSGKTHAVSRFINGAVERGLRVVGLKLTGVALSRDALQMKNNGAEAVYTFSDGGLPSTCGVNPLSTAIGCLNQAATHQPDIIAVEFGDGLLGDYGVDTILQDPSVQGVISALALAAPDPVAAWGGVEILTKWGIPTTVVVGQGTDNEAGVDAIVRHTQTPAINVRHAENAFVDHTLRVALQHKWNQRMQA